MALIWGDSNPPIECTSCQTQQTKGVKHPSNYKITFQISDEMKKLLKEKVIEDK